MEIGKKRLEEKGKKYAAYHIYEKMAEGREEREDQFINNQIKSLKSIN